MPGRLVRYARYRLGGFFLGLGRTENALALLNIFANEEPPFIAARCLLARAYTTRGTQRSQAMARDIFLSIVDDQSIDLPILREAAGSCLNGRLDRAAELWQRVAVQSGEAADYFHLSESLAAIDRLPEAVEALRIAARIDPNRYNDALHEVEQNGNGYSQSRIAVLEQPKKGRYPDAELIQNDFRRAVKDFVAADNHDHPKFILPNTVFFTMGSCFADNVVRALTAKGYTASRMPVSEYVNSTYANRYFVDWLDGTLPQGPIADRIQGWLPEGSSRDKIRNIIAEADVFILTLGVAPAFFERGTGTFVLPKPTQISSRSLAERYVFRTTTVEENVANLLHIIGFVRQLNPHSKIVVTESPVPLQITFEFRSAVVADCLSKSILRVAAHEIVNNSGLSETYYWPSFEVFRWLGAHVGPVYGTDDGAAWHVSEAIVDDVVTCFIETYKAT